MSVHKSITPEREAEIQKAMNGWLRWGSGKYRTEADRNTASRVVQSFQLELKTGKPHYCCHFEPCPPATSHGSMYR